MQTITFNIGMGEITMDEEDIAMIFQDRIFLQDAILAIINPEEADKSDISVPSKFARQYLRGYFLHEDYNWNKEFIYRVFREKYPCTNQEGAYYWAEPNELDGGKSFCVIFQADGYPPTEGFREWLGRFEDADDIAKRLAGGEDI